jgi:cystathionine beta-lyase/cystathionine gamma-synthase
MARKNINSIRMPVYRDSGFDLTDAGITAEAFSNELSNSREPDLYIYSRYRNPTVVSAEESIMELEGCNWALLAQTGMAAIDIALSVFQNGRDTGPWLFFNEIYGGTISFVENILKQKRGIDAQYFSPGENGYDLDKLEKTLAAVRPEIVYVETVSNPLVIVADVTNVTKLCGKYGAKVIVDNTFATPWLYRPLEAGTEIVIHSATKYFSGHGNLTAGVICGNDMQIMQKALEYRKFAGHMISPDDAYRLQTQIKTFKLRFPKQCQNALNLAGLLDKSPEIERTFYPGLASHGTNDIARRLFRDKGFGAMITFDLRGNSADEKRKRRDRFIGLVADRIRLIPTLGDSETILMPVEPVWGSKYPEPGMIRLSVGFEEYEELENTIISALERI